MNSLQKARIRRDCMTALKSENIVVAFRLNDPLGGLDSVAAFTVRQQYVHTRRAIEHAIKRIREGTYGRCERCHAEMWEHQAAWPCASLCIDCQYRADSMFFGKIHIIGGAP
jgi:hypothetical protein